ncbi:hypothetical protein NQ315_000957 [Exocentrus adspersus]|uniref:DNA replication ATP-dependent helicase/nuclease n=1 Tax=Exocentrus adspersus TaxID=1586481 RepID=A0AAV8WDY6_9CUCU|nr:hypothetical protein NQ315_000957 [Exocentrus adspersus]
MKKSKIQEIKGNSKITSFFVKKEVKDENTASSAPSETTTPCIGGLKGIQSIKSVSAKRKADNNKLSPPQKRTNTTRSQPREVTPERPRPNINKEPGCSSGSSSGKSPVISIKSPEQLLSPKALLAYYTPEKKLERYMDKIGTPTPKKRLFADDEEDDELLSQVIGSRHGRSRSRSKAVKEIAPNNLPEDSPSKTKKTPKKLFGKSPNGVHKYNVQIIENFIKITPVKSQKVEPDVVFVSSSEKKKQSSILRYLSPSPSPKSMQAQHKNETTPTKEQRTDLSSFHTPRLKVKTKLNFSTCIENKPSTSKMQEVQIPNIPAKCASKESRNVTISGSPKAHRDSSEDLENNLNLTNLSFSDWNEEMLMPTQDCKLDLSSESQHCKITGINTSFGKKIITLASTKSEEKAICTVEGFWFHCNLNVGDTVHISAKKINEEEWLINNDYGLLVYEPDLLISATSIVNTLWCKRKSILSDCFRGFEPYNEAMLVGNLVHTLLQHVLRNKIHTQAEIEQVASDLIKSRRIISNIYEAGLTLEQVEGEVMKFIPKIISFLHLYVKEINTDRRCNLTYNKDDWKGTITAIDDIEENIWCPQLGIKGKVDVSIKTDRDLMPLEVKTGRATISLEHRGQVLMYIMMMNQLGYKVPSGLLLYLREGVLREIPMTRKEKRDIIIMRNELTYYLTRKPRIVEDEQTKIKKVLPPELPEPINHKSCAKCPYNVICTAYAKFNNEDISSKKTLQHIQDEAFFYLEESHLNYFMHWVSLLALESNSTRGSKDIREIYTLTPEEREVNGRCIINLKVTQVGEECNGVFEHTFEKLQSEPGLNFFSYGLIESNYVVVSSTNRPAVSAGFVRDITATSITVALDRDLSKKYKNHSFHIDSYDATNIQSFNLTSLTLLMELTDRAEKLRRIIIEKVPPTFKSRLPKVIGTKGRVILKRLNVVQQRAVLRAIAANDYFLIIGMPGTGKTATVVALIQLLVELGKSVLITSHTHSAVDNVCLRLVTYGVKVLRLGSETRIHPSLKEYSEYTLTKDCTTPEQFEAVYNSAQVVAVTCLGSGHPVLSKRVLDICIVDESCQVLQSSVIRPLHSAKTFILIGDPNQLPAVVRSKEAREMGMSESLFERLNSKDATTALNLNYRMNATITALANQFTYEGELLIGSETVASATLKLPKKEIITSASSQWIAKALDDSLENAILDLCINLNALSHGVYKKSNVSEEIGENEKCANFYEAAVVFHLVKFLLEAGVPSADIGVITTYRAQVAQISLLLQSDGVDISTVDQFQGKDKSVIIYSSSRSSDSSASKKSELLEDKRRLTVAITRAKHKLLIVGDVSTLQEYSTFQKILPHVKIIRLYETLGFNWDKVLDNVNT